MSILPCESISNLAHRLDSLVPRAHQSIKDANALNAIKFNKFISILPNSYRMHILQCNIQTYVDAVEKARLLQDCEVNNELICQTSMNTPILDLKAQINELKKSIAHFGQKQPDSNTSSNLNQLSKNKNFNVQSVRQNRYKLTEIEDKLTEIKEITTEGSIDRDHFNDATISLLLDPGNILIPKSLQIRFVSFVENMNTPAVSVHHLVTTSSQRIQYLKMNFSHFLHSMSQQIFRIQ